MGGHHVLNEAFKGRQLVVREIMEKENAKSRIRAHAIDPFEQPPAEQQGLGQPIAKGFPKIHSQSKPPRLGALSERESARPC